MMPTLYSETDPHWAVTPEKVDAVIRRAVEAAHPRRIYLFGSYVNPKSDGSPPNDLDMMVIVDGSRPSGSSESVRLRRAVRDVPMSMDILVVDEDRFARLADMPNYIYKEVLATGRLVYDA